MCSYGYVLSADRVRKCMCMYTGVCTGAGTHAHTYIYFYMLENMSALWYLHIKSKIIWFILALSLPIFASFFSVTNKLPLSSIYLNEISLPIMWAIFLSMALLKHTGLCQLSGPLIHTCLQWQRSTPSVLVVYWPRIFYIILCPVLFLSLLNFIMSTFLVIQFNHTTNTFITFFWNCW